MGEEARDIAANLVQQIKGSTTCAILPHAPTIIRRRSKGRRGCPKNLLEHEGKSMTAKELAALCGVSAPQPVKRWRAGQRERLWWSGDPPGRPKRQA